jgi:iron(III) transport system permease protein
MATAQVIAAADARGAVGAWRWALRIAAGLAAAPALLALLSLCWSWASPDPQTWDHLRQHLLLGALGNSLLLMLGSGLCAAVVGTAAAALVSLCDFRGRRVVEILLVMPLAMPAYVLAYVWLANFDVGSPLRALAISATGSAAWLPSLRTPLGAIALLSMANYAYVYLLVRARLQTQGDNLFEAARSQGMAPVRAFLHGVLPALRPALAAGVALVMLESLAEFGAVSVLGIDTLSVLVYRTWYGLHALPVATQLASLMLLLALLIAPLERVGRGRADARGNPARSAPRPLQLGAGATAMALLLVALLILPAFLLPALRLAAWALQTHADWPRMVAPMLATAGVSGAAALAIVAAGLALAAAARVDRTGRTLRRIAGLGYAVPGVVLAVALMFVLVAAERALAAQGLAGIALSSSLLAIGLGLLARFVRIGVAAADSGIAALRPALDEAARSLGAGRGRRILRVQLPLLRPALAGGFLLAFVECAKELPVTLMLRPFGFDTLAVKVYNATSEGLWLQAAAPALLLCLLGTLPAIALLRRAR